MPIAPFATPAPILLIQSTPSPGGQRPVAPPLRPVHMPDNLKHVTHVRIKRSKPGPLGHQYEGPFEIVRRLGNTRLELRVGSKANGDPRYEVWNWEDCKPAVLDERLPPPTVERTRRGRKPTTPGKPKTPDKFYPTTDLAVPGDGLDDLTDDFLPDAPPVLVTPRGRKPKDPGTPKPPDELLPTIDNDVPDDDIDELTDEISGALPLITRFGRRSKKPTRFVEL